jgi:hypothetical protein
VQVTPPRAVLPPLGLALASAPGTPLPLGPRLPDGAQILVVGRALQPGSAGSLLGAQVQCSHSNNNNGYVDPATTPVNSPNATFAVPYTTAGPFSTAFRCTVVGQSPVYAESLPQTVGFDVDQPLGSYTGRSGALVQSDRTAAASNGIHAWRLQRADQHSEF